MVKKIIILTTTALFMSFSGYSQEADNGPKKGDFMLSTSIGYSNYIQVAAPQQGLTSYKGQALNTNWFDKGVTTNIEGTYFVTDRWALRLSGGLGFSTAPGYDARPGTYDPNENPGVVGDPNDIFIPGYEAVGNSKTMSYNVAIGFNHYKNLGVKNLYLTMGGQVGFAYGNNVAKFANETAMGRTAAEAYSTRIAFNMGTEYHFLPGMYIGLEISPVSYIYNVTSLRPEDGLARLSADSHNIGFLAAPTLKLGFKF